MIKEVLGKLLLVVSLEMNLKLNEKAKKTASEVTRKKHKKYQYRKSDARQHFYTSAKTFTNEYYDLPDKLVHANL